MKNHWVNESLKYDGLQMVPIWAYTRFGLLGDSMISFKGPCQILHENILDVEDQRENQKIQGDLMLHFIVEVFNQTFSLAVTLQRLLVCIVQKEIEKKSGVLFERKGDDLFYQDRKLSISIAAVSSVSAKIHLALNITNEGTPVPTCCLSEFKIKEKEFAEEVMTQFCCEWDSILNATYKVHPL